MIAPPANTQIWIAAGVTDLRRGFTGLSALVQSQLEQSPFSGHVFVFRGRRGDLIKLLWFDGDGMSIFEAAGKRTIHLAAGDERHGFVNAGAVIDATGRH
jgi:transposase